MNWQTKSQGLSCRRQRRRRTAIEVSWQKQSMAQFPDLAIPLESNTALR